MTNQIIRVRWSKEILDETVGHLIKNVDAFDEAAGERLVAAMNRTFPYSHVNLTDEAIATVADFVLTDEDDRHVIAAADAAQRHDRRAAGHHAEGSSHRRRRGRGQDRCRPLRAVPGAGDPAQRDPGQDRVDHRR